MSDNIIQFPKNNITKNFPINVDQSYEHIEEVRRDYCEEVSDDIMDAVFAVASSYNININLNETDVKYLVFLEEAIKALIFNSKKLHHPFQDLAQETITLTEDARQELKDIIAKKAVDHLSE